MLPTAAASQEGVGHQCVNHFPRTICPEAAASLADDRSCPAGIHKSQGMTLDAAVVKIAGCFDAGMAYVAPSRVRDIDNLRFRRLCGSLNCQGCATCRCELTLADIKVRPEVQCFYDLITKMDIAVRQLAAALGDHRLPLMGTCDVTVRAQQCLGDGRPDVAQLAHTICSFGERLNPGVLDGAQVDPDAERPNDRVWGWWTIRPTLKTAGVR